MKQYLLGIDAGTTSFKAAVFQKDGSLVAVKSQNYTLLTPSPQFVELRVETYWETLCTLLHSLFEKAGISGEEIASLAISSQGETLVCLDKDGEPTYNAIVWMDNRSEEEADELRARFGKREVYEKTGQSDVVATWTATKILWLQKNEPDVFQKTAQFLLLEDYLIYRLTGKFACEKNLLCSSLLYDIQKEEWWEEMLSAIGIDEQRLPQVYQSGQKIASVQGKAAKETGLSVETLVCAGALDQTCGIIGAGNVRAGIITETTGSCLAVSANLDKFVPYDEEHPITCQNHAMEGRYVVLLSTQTAGMVLKWFANNFYKAEKESVKNVFAFIDEEAEQAPAGCEGLLMLPHLTGAANPEFDPNARGVFYGITMGHERGHFARAILEAVSYMLRRQLEQIEGIGIPFDTVYSMGGGASSPLWSQIKADVTQKEIRIIENPETACLGAAILAGVGCGVFQSIEEAASELGAHKVSYAPDSGLQEVYDSMYQRYIALYEALKPVFKQGM